MTRICSPDVSNSLISPAAIAPTMTMHLHCSPTRNVRKVPRKKKSYVDKIVLFQGCLQCITIFWN